MMKLSMFRSKSAAGSSPSPTTPTSRKASRFSQILSPSRSIKSEASNDHLPISPIDLAHDELPRRPHTHDDNINRSEIELPPIPSSGFVDGSDMGRRLAQYQQRPPQTSRSMPNSDSLMDEHEMARKLMDVESSFMPDTFLAHNNDKTNVPHSSSVSRNLDSSDSPSLRHPTLHVDKARGRNIPDSQANDLRGSSNKLAASHNQSISSSIPSAADQQKSQHRQSLLSLSSLQQSTSTHQSIPAATHLSSKNSPTVNPPDAVTREPFVPGADDDHDDNNDADYITRMNLDRGQDANNNDSSSVRAEPDEDIAPSSPLASLVAAKDRSTIPQHRFKDTTALLNGTGRPSHATNPVVIAAQDSGAEVDQTPTQARHGTIKTPGVPESPTRQPIADADEKANEHDTSAASSNVPGKRPKYLQNHQASQRSSASSFVSHSAQSDAATMGRDSAHHSRATGATSGAVRQSNELSRFPSLGSMASSLSEDIENNKRLHGANMPPIVKPSLERVDEHTPVPTPPQSNNNDNAKTPLNNYPGSVAIPEPSETVLAKHIRDIQVPETVAREYRSANPSNLPDPSHIKTMVSTPSFGGRGRTNLTLKEQNGRIDKLSKENFDLKLKIHYLYQALENRSEEGVKDLISNNAQLQADLVKSRKETQSLRKRIRELELQRKTFVPSHITEEEIEDELSSRGFNQTQMEEEIIYLRNRMQQLEEEREILELQQIHGDNEAAAAILSEERALRQKAEREVRDLRVQTAKLKGDPAPLRTLKHQRSYLNLEVAAAASGDEDAMTGSEATLVDQLRQENAGLRRDLGAQTSMLTSHTRERERLQQEIEDLKLGQRRTVYRIEPDRDDGGDDEPRGRTRSRNQVVPSPTVAHFVGDSDREQYENAQAGLRDENARLRMRNQDLIRDIDNLRDNADMLVLAETERDEATQALREADADVDYLTEAVKELEDSIAQKEEAVSRLEMELRRREKESGIFQAEIKSIGDSLNRLVEDSESSQITIQTLQSELVHANGELETMEHNLRDAVSTKERLEVQAESSQSMIAFLREEQDSDKMKIGDLESALKTARVDIKNNKDRAEVFDELETGMSQSREEARRLRKALAAKEVEATNSQLKLEELESGLRRAFGQLDGSGAFLLKEIRKVQLDLESANEELDGARENLAEMDRRVKDRESLLESSGLEAKRLSDLLDREKQARKHDQNEYERSRRKNAHTKAEERIVDLEDEVKREQKKLAYLEQQYGQQLKERNALLFTLWEQLSTLCGADWAAENRLLDERGNDLSTDSMAQNMLAFSSGIISATAQLETLVAEIDTELRGKAESIWEQVHALEQSLNNRIKRLDKVERALSRYRHTAGTELEIALKDLSRAKEENRRLRKEVKFLKEGSFALPGLPSPMPDDSSAPRDDRRSERGSTHRQKHISSSASAMAETPTPSGSRSRQRSSQKTSRPMSAHVSGSTPQENTPNQRHHRNVSLRGGHLTAGVDESVTERSNSVNSLRQDDSSDNNLHNRQQRPNETSLVTTGKKRPSSSATTESRALQPRSPGSLSQREQTWILRLEELKRALNSEREARLLDREGARQRLEDGQDQTRELKAALLREKARNKATGSDTVQRNGASGHIVVAADSEVD